MNRRSILHALGCLAILLAFGGGLWWSARRWVSAAAAGEPLPIVIASAPATHPAESASTPPVAARTLADFLGTTSPERRALRDRLIEQHQELARQQDEALSGRAGLEGREGRAEADHESALVAFAEARREELIESARLRADWDRRTDSDADPAVWPGADARRARFDRVRQSLLDENLSLEEAEARFGPDDPAR